MIDLCVLAPVTRRSAASEGCLDLTPVGEPSGSFPPVTLTAMQTQGNNMDPWYGLYAARTAGLSASEVRALFAVASRPEVVSLAGGMPFVSALPQELLTGAVERTVRDRGATALQYGSGQGMPQLREQIRAILTGGDKDRASPVGMLLPLLDPNDFETLRLAASDGDFLIRERAARFMASAPRMSQIALLEVLVNDRYPQVAQAAIEALSALKPSS